MAADELHIPKHSFTAFRLTYSTSRVVSESSKVVFLGTTPDIWQDEGTLHFVSGFTKYARKQVKKKFNVATDLVNTSIRRATFRYDENEEEGGAGDEAFNIFESDRKRFNSAVLFKALEQQQERDDDSINSDTYSENQDSKPIDINGDMDYIATNGHTIAGEGAHDIPLIDIHPTPLPDESTAVSVEPFKPTPIIIKGSSDEDLTPRPFTGFPLDVVNTRNSSPSFDYSRTPLLHISHLGVRTPDRESIVLSQESMRLTVPNNTNISNSQDGKSFHSAYSHSIQSEDKYKPGVKFQLDSTRKSKISIELPQPMELAETEYTPRADSDFEWAEKEHRKFTKKLRSLATASRKLAHDTKKVRKRIYRNVLNEYEDGEIIRLDKYLVMTKILRNVKNVSNFNENEFCDSRIYERWTEYFCVLRKTSNPRDPLSLELYDIHNKIDSRKPDVNFALSPEIGASIYSDSDMSFCITVPKDSHVVVYIFKARSQITSIRTLFFIKNLGQKISHEYNVSIPDIGIKLDIEVPFSEIRKAFESRPEITIQQLEKGYQIGASPILQYLKSRVIEILKSRNISQFDEWIKKLEWPWFCFKQYDTLDWVMNNSQLFLMQYNILKNNYQLELRNMDTSYFYTEHNGKKFREPYPIEGFLFRMTNTSGKGKSFLRSFHKMLYFYSCDKALFFTKFYRGVPPKRDFTSEESEIESKVYEHSPFPLDSHEHITWLNSEKFEESDQAALAEFKRRSQQIIKAEALLDMTLIKDIRIIPLDKISKTHKIFLSLYWYSTAECVVDESIVDSAFEIEMDNGSLLKLQAPNRAMRDEWISRIANLRNYWISREQDDLERIMSVRARNQKELKISEYVDSNVKQELGVNEYFFGLADPLIHNINSLAMMKSMIMSGYLYQKGKKHSSFNQYYVVLCPGFLILFSVFKRSKVSGLWQKNPLYEHYFTIPIAECYLYSGITTLVDLLQDNRSVDPRNPSQRALPRLYPDGWKSSEEEHTRCFTLWFGKKRQIHDSHLALPKENEYTKSSKKQRQVEMNPGITTMVKRLGLTGKSIVFMARSRQERELWTYNILSEIDRFAKT